MKLVPQPPKEEKPSDEVLEIQVSGLKDFEGERWRAAIEHYFAAQNRGKWPVTYRPKLYFWMGGGNSVTLRLAAAKGEYYAYGTASNSSAIPTFSRGIRTIGCKQGEVEANLREFMKTNSFRMLVIKFSETAKVVLWKGRKRSFLGVAAIGIPEDYDR